MEEREPQRRLDRRRAQVALDPGQDRRQPDQLAIRVQVENHVDQVLAAVGDREPLAQPLPHLGGADVARGPLSIGRSRLDRLVLGSALLVAAQRASIVDALERAGPPLRLVDCEVAAAGDALRAEHVRDREAHARVAVR